MCLKTPQVNQRIATSNYAVNQPTVAVYEKLYEPTPFATHSDRTKTARPQANCTVSCLNHKLPFNNQVPTYLLLAAIFAIQR